MKFYRAVVEDNNDPLKCARVKVRIYGIHTKNNENSGEFSNVKTSDLPWAEIMGDNTFGLISGVGLSNVLRNGTWVWVVLDNDNPNKPIVIGTITGIVTENAIGKQSSGEGFYDPNEIYPFETRSKTETDFNRLAKAEKLNDAHYDEPVSIYGSTDTIHKQINDNVDIVSGETDGYSGADVSQTEPNSLDDNTAYPNSSVLETHSGHVITLDDTEGNERVRVYHTSGSYIEIRPDGTFIQKSVNTDAESHYIHMSDVQEHVAKGVKRYIEDNLEEIIGKEVKRYIKSNQTEHIGGNLKLKVDGNLTWEIGGNISITSGGTQTTSNGGNYTHTAPNIFLN